MKAYVSTIKSVRMGNGISVNIYELRIFKDDKAQMTGKGRTKPDLYIRRTSGHGHPAWMLRLEDRINYGLVIDPESSKFHLKKEEREDLSRLLGIKGDEDHT